MILERKIKAFDQEIYGAVSQGKYSSLAENLCDDPLKKPTIKRILKCCFWFQVAKIGALGKNEIIYLLVDQYQNKQDNYIYKAI
jgi:hypothetical protein